MFGSGECCRTKGARPRKGGLYQPALISTQAEWTCPDPRWRRWNNRTGEPSCRNSVQKILVFHMGFLHVKSLVRPWRGRQCRNFQISARLPEPNDFNDLRCAEYACETIAGFAPSQTGARSNRVTGYPLAPRSTPEQRQSCFRGPRSCG